MSTNQYALDIVPVLLAELRIKKLNKISKDQLFSSLSNNKMLKDPNFKKRSPSFSQAINQVLTVLTFNKSINIVSGTILIHPKILNQYVNSKNQKVPLEIVEDAKQIALEIKTERSSLK